MQIRAGRARGGKVGQTGQHRRTGGETYTALVNRRFADTTLDVGKLIVAVAVQGGGHRGGRGVGEGKVWVVVLLISLPYRNGRGCCSRRRGAHLIRRRGRESGGTADRRGLYKVVDVHGIARERGGRNLRLLVDGAAQLRDSAGCGGEGWPRGWHRSRGSRGRGSQRFVVGLAVAARSRRVSRKTSEERECVSGRGGG